MPITRKNPLILGVDIGGSHITAALIDNVGGQVILSSKVCRDIDSNADSDTILNDWSSAIGTVCNDVDKRFLNIAIAMPGPFNYESGISWIINMNKYESLYGINIREALAERLQVDSKQITFRNDAEAFLNGEVLYGSAKGFKSVLGLTLGTGLGSAVSKNGVTRDINFGSSKFNDGIAEDYISSRWFVNRYYELTSKKILGVKELLSLTENIKEVEIIFEEFSQNLSNFINVVSKNENPEIVIIGGNIVKANYMFWERLESLIAKENNNIILRMSLLGEDAAIMGASIDKNLNNLPLFY